MIKRTYFMSVKKVFSDGSTGYSTGSIMFSPKSWFSDPNYAHDQMKAELEDSLKDSLGDQLYVVSFNDLAKLPPTGSNENHRELSGQTLVPCYEA